jgi:hypothetical protein
MTTALPIRTDVQQITYWRKPTPGELKFREGAIHYRDFTPAECCHVAKDDGLRYHRS